MMRDKNDAPRKDRIKDRTNIGEVRFLIEDFMEAQVIPSCVHVEAVLEEGNGGSLLKKLLVKSKRN